MFATPRRPGRSDNSPGKVLVVNRKAAVMRAKAGRVARTDHLFPDDAMEQDAVIHGAFHESFRFGVPTTAWYPLPGRRLLTVSE